ncbi:hypothetical protein K493DRAFT_404399 [Basidiobolus meristosporus CBS 931.73]|uniref:MSP domain-containing protein n=1 Tax=Basidiobolus meristosporus CBS 931.73 TaxID=1314790 RepID=A0A1Y1Z4L3_9FUNG|nr:hypothetical protein K493DRAFT_404399 [Basidiobolus meristosporus CBS 931.73]|eukprot:ORY05203.1 hypothetical protein K493DRAFT_404399 [Basidiobolus meristosporus CBS 931.73]
MDVPNQENLVRISPKEFAFAGQFTKLGPVGFKFKTNAPLRYSVRPVYGVLESFNSIAEVYVRCESEVQSSDRFLIQTALLTEKEAENMGPNLINNPFFIQWKSLDRKRILEHFINCKVVENSVYTSHSRSSSNDSLLDNKGFSTVNAKRMEPLTKSTKRSHLEPLKEDNDTSASKDRTLTGIRFSRQELFLISFVFLMLGIFVPVRQVLQLLT